MRIGKRATAECQCGAAKQDVAHILLRSRFTHESRKQAQRDLRAPNLSMRRLLYTPEGAEVALRIWGEFEQMRHQFEQETRTMRGRQGRRSGGMGSWKRRRQKGGG